MRVCLQTRRYRAEHDVKQPLDVCFSGSAKICILKLVAFTGDRSLREAAMSAPRSHESAVYAAVGRDGDIDLPDGMAAAARTLVAIVDGDAPAELKLELFIDVLEAADYVMAYPLLPGLTKHLALSLLHLGFNEVCTLPCLCCSVVPRWGLQTLTISQLLQMQ